MNKRKLLKSMIQSRGKNVLFMNFVAVVESFGFKPDRINGSHHIFVNKKYNQLISIQNDGKNAKPYQVKQFIAIIDMFNIRMED